MIETIHHSGFQHENHWYPKLINTQINPLVSHFFKMDIKRIVTRYCHLHPSVKPSYLEELFTYKPQYFFWSGGDLINVTSSTGKRQMVLIETNSCPSGQKSTPLLDDFDEYGGYSKLIAGGVQNFLKGKRMSSGVLAVFYDKNPMESSGYAHALSNHYDEQVYLVKFFNGESNDHVKIEDNKFHILVEGEWLPVRFVFRYLTQKPWNRLPVDCKTLIFNPIVTCLAGGRNKLLASKAYDFFNAELGNHHLQINTPETHMNIRQEEIPYWYEKFGGNLVVKSPYSNAGQGVFLISNRSELEVFMNSSFDYETFIVQSLIGNHLWSSVSEKGKLYHVGTLPDKNNLTYVSDLRMMIHYTSTGFKPLCMYARRAEEPLPDTLQGHNTWSVLGTNISVKKGENKWDYDVKRLITLDRRDFNKLGLGMDDLIEAFMQTIFATIAIDKMASTLVSKKERKLKRRLFYSLNPDQSLLDEIMK